MTSGFGVDPTKDNTGAVISGTSSTDIQNIFGSLYTPGIVSGGSVYRSSTDMSYRVDAGTVMIPTYSTDVENGAIPAAVRATTVPTAAAPASGTRLDIIYAQQRFPSIEGDSELIVAVGTTLPPRAVALGKYNVPAGITTTSGANFSGSSPSSIPYGAGLGTIYQSVDQWNGVHNQSNMRLGNGEIVVQTDRLLRYSITAVLAADGAVGFDNSKYCEWYFIPELDNQPLAYWNSPGLHQAWGTYQFEGFFTVPAGSHNVSYSRGRATGPGSARTAYGMYGGHFFPGTTFTITDAGVLR